MIRLSVRAPAIVRTWPGTLVFPQVLGHITPMRHEGGLPVGRDPGDYLQIVLGQDLSYAWEHWQLWFEVYEARFEVPNVGDADTLGYYLEAKYKFTPNLFGALRWNQQFFGEVPDGSGAKEPWGNDISRLDAAVTYRFTPSSQIKLQYGIQHEDRAKDDVSHLVAAQFTVRFYRCGVFRRSVSILLQFRALQGGCSAIPMYWIPSTP